MNIAVAGGRGVVGSHAVESAREASHSVTVLSRRNGVDVRSGDGLLAALEGVDVVIDALNSSSIRRAPASAFFETTSRNLQELGARQGVRHLVALSILGVDRVKGYGYYDAKLAHERAISTGPLPVTILRATQFHEFPAQIMAVSHHGPIAIVPTMQCQPVAARTVGAQLVRVAEEQAGGIHELAGPNIEDLGDMAKRIASLRAASFRVLALRLPGRAAKQMRQGALLATDKTTIDGPSFTEWLAGPDAQSVSL
jgi:uncharacterized protein YbjT (DUF2867 family)